MKPSNDHLIEFVEKLACRKFIDPKMVDKVFEGVDSFIDVARETPIFGYEQIAYTLSAESSLEELKRLLIEMASELELYPDERYYFVEALVAGAGAYEDQALARSLIGLAPGSYRRFLNMRFGVF